MQQKQKQRKYLIPVLAVGAGLLLLAVALTPASAFRETSCYDGIDNDADGLIDSQDIDCFVPSYCPPGYTMASTICVPIIPQAHPTYELSKVTLDYDYTANAMRSIDFVVGVRPTATAFGPNGVDVLLHVRVLDRVAGIEMGHVTKQEHFQETNADIDTHYVGEVSGLSACTTYDAFAYVTNAAQTESYRAANLPNALEAVSFKTPGCAPSLSALGQWLACLTRDCY